MSAGTGRRPGCTATLTTRPAVPAFRKPDAVAALPARLLPAPRKGSQPLARTQDSVYGTRLTLG